MDIGGVLTEAGRIVWRHKILWLFGIMAGCSGVPGAGGGNTGFRFSGDEPLPPEMEQFFQRVPTTLEPGWIALLVLLALVLVVVVIVLTTFGRIGVVRGAQIADEGAVKISFGQLWGEGRRYFWRVLGLNLLVGLTIGLAAALIAVAVAGVSILTLGIGLICLLPLLCLLIPLAWFLYVYLEIANAALIVEDVGIAEGLSRGWSAVRAHLGEVIIMGLILTIGAGLIGGFIIGIPLVLVALPLIGGVFVDSVRSGLVISLLCLVAVLPFWLVLNGLLQSYIFSAWTLTYRRLSGALPEKVALA